MAKVLITADVHVSNYRNYNLFDNPEFRLQQFKKLSQRLVSIIQERPEIEAVVIAGDFLHVAAPRPYVTNKAFDFLSKIANWCPVYLTHGQHDIDTRRTGIEENTLLSLCNHNKDVHYLHKETVTIGGCEFYFLGWVPDLDSELAHLEVLGGTDVFIGHFQPGTVRVGQRNFLLSGGRDIPDAPPWKIAFVGDVHTHQVTRGNIVVPGVPIQHSFNDDPCPGVILYDTETNTWERIETIVPGQWDFLRLLISDDYTLTDDWTVVRPQTQTQTTKLQKTFEKKLNIAEVIDEQVQHHTLDKVHSDVLSYVSNTVRQDVDLNFEVEKIVIHDFRSIHEFEWDNVGEGVKLLFGQNGTGKSSLVTALMFALSGEGSGRTLTRKGCNNMYVEVTLLYGRLRHTLRRGWTTSGKLRYWINDVEQQAENQRALLEKIEDNLPFLRFTDLIYHQQDRPGFLSSYNYSARVDLISRVLGLQIVQALHDEAQRRVLDFDRQLATLRAKIATVNAIVEQETLVDFTFMEMIDDGKETNLKTLRDSIKSLVREERQKSSATTTKQATLVSRIERGTRDVATLEERRGRLSRRNCYTCGQSVDDTTYETLYAEISTEILTKISDLSEWRTELDTLDVPSTDLVDKLEVRLEDILRRLSEITSMREHHSKLLQLKTRIEDAKTELLTLRVDQNHLIAERETITEYKTLLEPTGPIMRTLLLTLSDMLSSETLRVRAHKQLVSGEIRPDFSVDVCISGSWIPYDELSGGQKTLTDLMILEKLIQLAGGLGLIIFDETFKFLDGENLEKIVDVIKHMHCSNIFIVSHVEGFPYWDASIHTTLDKDNATRYTIR